MILESETLDSFENECIDVQENGYDQAFNNVGSHGSQSYIENIFREQNVNFKMIMDKELDSLSHIYSWNSINDKKYGPFKRRFWFVWNNNFNEFKL
jgi:tetrahydromethanopterin S-methyltransferase subunit A